MDHAEVGVLTKENVPNIIQSHFALKIQLTKMATHIIVVEKLEYDTTVMMITRLTILVLYLTVQYYYSGATSFSRNVISLNRRFTEMHFFRIVVLPKKKIAERHFTKSSYGRIVELAKLYNAERHCYSAEHHFPESSFSRTSFSRNIVCSNVILSKLYEAKCHLTEH